MRPPISHRYRLISSFMAERSRAPRSRPDRGRLDATEPAVARPPARVERTMSRQLGEPGEPAGRRVHGPPLEPPKDPVRAPVPPHHGLVARQPRFERERAGDDALDDLSA